MLECAHYIRVFSISTAVLSNSTAATCMLFYDEWCPDVAGVSSGWWLVWVRSRSQVPMPSCHMMWSVHHKGTLKGAFVTEVSQPAATSHLEGCVTTAVLHYLTSAQNKMCV